MVYICAKIVNVFCFCKLWDCYRGDSGYRLIVFAERFACLDFLERVAIPGEDSSYSVFSGDDWCSLLTKEQKYKLWELKLRELLLILWVIL
jgi:hypothetical protein